MGGSAPTEELETYVLTGSIGVIERFFEVPLNWDEPDGQKIRVFARNLLPVEDGKVNICSDRPYMVYLQGGPGFECSLFSIKEMATILHERGYQTLWLDQRGTGLSTPLSAEHLEGKTDQEIAQYVKYFRADSIVKDCECIRKSLIGEHGKWSLLGQSYGGCCCMTYLSFFNDSLKEVFIAGGLITLADNADIVYEHTIVKNIERNKVYYKKYPEDVQRGRRIMDYLHSNKVVLPFGGQLTPTRWQWLGMDFGMQNGIDRVHQLVLRATNDLDLFGRLSQWLLRAVGNQQQSLDTNPIYAILHEPVYCQGKAPNWAAYRTMQKHDNFWWDKVKDSNDDTPIYYFGEWILPSMYDDFSNLAPLKGAAHILAKDDKWPALYDLDQLKKNKVKVNAATYIDDMYVEFSLAQETAAAIGNLDQYITNQFFHSGLSRDDPRHILGELFKISKREKF